MGIQSDTTSKKANEAVKENSDVKPVNIENMAMFSSYETLKDGTRIFSAED